ncbi:MAG: hypothetical protein QOE71_2547 [Pseudonocardiales bacterium]|nr:hypothetical protein [Pseudonocardiales bacterium]
MSLAHRTAQPHTVTRVSHLDALSSNELIDRLRLLGFAEQDADDTRQAAHLVLADPTMTQSVSDHALRIGRAIGGFLESRAPAPVAEPESAVNLTGVMTSDVLKLLAFVATSGDIAKFHRQRGVSSGVSRATLADLGRHVALHRGVHGSLGLETHRWLELHWSGSLYQLGRLQLDLGRIDQAGSRAAALPNGVRPGDWAPGVHIPEGAPLDEAAVRDSLARFGPFLSDHFPEVTAVTLHCRSWMLDHRLADVLPVESNLVRFQRLFELDGTSTVGDQDIVYFVFHQRGLQDLDRLPRHTRLQRAVLDHLGEGGHWFIRQGWRPL